MLPNSGEEEKVKMRILYLVLSVLLILLGLLFILVQPLTGLLGLCTIYLRTKLKKDARGKWVFRGRESPENIEKLVSFSTPQNPTEEVLKYVGSSVGFPEIDDKGMLILRILDNVKLTGVTKKYKGVNPQNTIKMLSEGEEIFFERISMEKFPNATLVINCSDHPIGWIPEAFPYQEDIAKRLDDGTTVKARVNTIMGGMDGKNYGITIDIARYTKQRK